MSRRGATLGVSLALAVGLGVGGSQLPVPYVGLGPGPVYNTLGTGGSTPLIQVPADRDHPAKGELDLTTVNVYSELSLGRALLKWFDHRYAVVPREVIYPPGQTPQQSAEDTKREMQESQQHAVTAALCELGTPVRSRVVVDGVGKDTPAQQAGIGKDDVLLAIDGRPVDSVCTLRSLMGRHQPGDRVDVTVRRAPGDERVIPVATRPGEMTSDGRPMLGVSLVERDPKAPFPVTIALNDVGGPSAGLMFALGIYDRLTEGDLTGGKVVAGTGTIDDDGAVGPIGGIQQKLYGARQHGATYFLVPAGNWDDANRSIPDGLRLVRVATLREAITAVRAIASGTTP